MRLTIHYGLTTDLVEVESIRITVRRIRQLALRLPFQKVGDVIAFGDRECEYSRADPHRWLKIQAGQYVKDGEHYVKVVPLHFIAFTILPAWGSEPANFGFARYPEIVDVPELDKQLKTDLIGWRWKSFCKTQYASACAVGGVANFVRCHASVISLLDALQSSNLARVYVNDESDFWKHRDYRKLAKSVGEWNETVAAVVGQLKDLANGLSMDAPITQFPNFEHLEGRGRGRLDAPPSSSVDA